MHTTKRRQRRANWHGHAFAVVVAGAIIALLALGGRNAPPDVSPLERQTAARPTAEYDDADPNGERAPPGVDSSKHAPRPGTAQKTIAAATREKIQTPTGATPEIPAPRSTARASLGDLSLMEMVEIEQMLLRLDLDPSAPDGLIDAKTISAIRMYQQIAGLPENGTPSKALLEDMREVVRILDKSE